MQCTLFGATGFIGSHVAEVLVGAGHAVTACVRQTSDVSELLRLGIAIERPNEATPCTPEFPYQQASYEREQVLLELAARTSLHVVLLRAASASGRRNPPLERLAKAHAQGRFPVIGPGNVPFSAVDARNFGRAMLWLAECTPADERIYLLRTSETSWLGLKDVMDRLRNKRTRVQRLPVGIAYALARGLEWITPYSKEPIFTRFVVRLLTTPHLYDDSKLRATGFVPRYGVEESIAALLDTGL